MHLPCTFTRLEKRPKHRRQQATREPRAFRIPFLHLMRTPRLHGTTVGLSLSNPLYVFRSSSSRFTATTLERTPPSSIRSFNTISIDDERRSSLLHSLERLPNVSVLVRATRVRIHRRCAGAGRSFLRFIEGRRGADTRTCRRRAVACFEDAKGCKEQRRRIRNVAPVVRETVRRRRDDDRCERTLLDGFHVRVHASLRRVEAVLRPPPHREALPTRTMRLLRFIFHGASRRAKRFGQGRCGTRSFEIRATYFDETTRTKKRRRTKRR